MHLLSMEVINLKYICFLISTNHKQIVQMAAMFYLIITKDGIFVENLSLFLQNVVPLCQASWKKIKM